ncbi:MAG: MFS transporter [Planctomycetota bacterium]
MENSNAVEQLKNKEFQEIAPGERRKGLRISTLEGMFATVHGNLTGGVIFTSFLITLGAKNFHFAVLNAVSGLAQLVQIFSAFFISLIGKRKIVVIISALLSRLVLCAIVALPYLMSWPTALKVVIGAAFLWGALGSISGNAWSGWMSDLVPRRIRGRYFSSRNFVLMLTTIIFSLAAAWFLDQFSREPGKGITSLLPSVKGKWIFFPVNKMKAYVLLYSLGAIPAIISAMLIKRQVEPTRIEKARKQLKDFWASVKEPLKHSIFVKFLIFTSIYSLINSIAAPYWSPFLLENLQISITTLAVCALVSQTCGLLTTRLWGSLCDKYGNRPVIVTTMFFASFHPLFYLIATKNFIIPVYIDFASSGIMWMGFGIAMTNFLYTTATIEGKEMLFAVYGIAGAGMVFVGSLLSGLLLSIIPSVNIKNLTWNNIQILFLLTSTLRFLALIFAIKLINETNTKSVRFMIKSLIGLKTNK